MKSKKDISELKDTIQSELGIDISKYQDEQVAENLVDLLLFPKYVAKWVAIPVLLCLLVYLVGFFIVDLAHVQYLIYAIFGFLLFLLFGVFLGVVNLGNKLGKDVSSISEYSMGLLKNSVMDIEDMGSRVNKTNVKDVLGLLFKGVIFVVTIPMLHRAVDKKVPTGKMIIKKLLGGSLTALANRVTFDPEKIDENHVVVDGESKFMTKYVSTVEKASSGTSGLIKGVLKIATTPFRLGVYVTGFLLILFIYLIW